MRLSEYFQTPEGRRRGEKARVARVAGVMWNTIHVHIKTGEPIVKYDTAKRISDATGGVVSIAELCEPAPPAPIADEPAQHVDTDEESASEPPRECGATQ